MKALNKEILRLALPSILANITVPLVGIVDLAIAGHLTGGEAATLIGGVSIGSMLFDLLYWNFGFLRVGTGGMTAQAWGRGDRHEMASLLCRGVGLSFLIAFFMLLLQWPFVKAVFLFVDCSPQVRALAEQYFFIRIWAAPASLSLMAFRGWFIGMQDSVSSMVTDLIVNCVNIAASLILSHYIGFAGIATGTVVAQYAGLIFALCVVLVKYRRTTFQGFGIADIRASYRGRELRKFMRINGDFFIRSLCMVAVYIGFTTLSARYGDLMLATASIMMKLLLLFSYFTDGFAYAGEALTGRFFGAADKPMVRKTVGHTFVWSMGIGLGFVLVYVLGTGPLLHLMTSDTSVIEACRLFFVWLLPMPLIGCAAFTWDGIFVGATASVPMRDSAIAAVIAFFVFWLAGISLLDVVRPGLADLPSPVAGANVREVTAIHILLVAYFAHLATRTIWLTVRYRPAVLDRVPEPANIQNHELL